VSASTGGTEPTTRAVAGAAEPSGDESGGVAILVVAVVVVAVLLVHGVARVAVASHIRVRARTAADAAALAAADALALGGACTTARADAVRYAAANGASLVGFTCDGAAVVAVVVVRSSDALVGVVRATARAEVDPTCVAGVCG
jgi:hypothetical protein